MLIWGEIPYAAASDTSKGCKLMVIARCLPLKGAPYVASEGA